MDENYSLALGEKTLSSPSQSMLAPFIPVYGHCNYASSSLLLYMSLWIPHSPSFFKRSLPFSSLFSSSFFSCKNQSSSLIYPIINSIIIWDDKRIGIIRQNDFPRKFRIINSLLSSLSFFTDISGYFMHLHVL